MTSRSGPLRFFFAILLAVLVPLSQAHCLWMAFGEQPTSASLAQGVGCHACCPAALPDSPPEVPTPSDRAIPECPCFELPTGSLPLNPSILPAPAAPLLATVVVVPSIPSTETIEAPAPALDIGVPRTTPIVGAHGLRAPPLPA